MSQWNAQELSVGGVFVSSAERLAFSFEILSSVEGEERKRLQCKTHKKYSVQMNWALKKYNGIESYQL